jgi:hypothetical protein
MRAAIPRLFRLLAILAACASAAAYDWEAARLPPSARASAIGGVHAALTDELYTMFSNPAGLRSAAREMQLAELTLNLSGPIFDMTGVVIRGANGEDVDEMLLDPDVDELLTGLHAGLSAAGPISFAYAGGGLGFGIYNWFDLGFDSASSAAIDTLVAENFLVTGGYATRVPLPAALGGTLDVGGMLKTSIRGEASTTKSLVELADLYSNPSSLLSGEPYTLSLAFGIDLGALYRRGDLWALGLVVRDAFTPTRRSRYGSFQDFLDSVDPVTVGSGRVRPDVSIGARYSPRIVAWERVVNRFQFLLDYSDIFDFAIDPATARNPFLHVSLGAEAVILEIVSVRVGFGQGLPAAGFEIDLSFMDLSLSMFGTELSTEPGIRPTYNLVFGMRFTL